MARVIYTKFPHQIALAILIDRARTYLLRARAHKQKAQFAKDVFEVCGISECADDVVFFTHLAKLNRYYAKMSLKEAMRITVDTRSFMGQLDERGLTILEGNRFNRWPQYHDQFEITQDLWGRRNDGCLKKHKPAKLAD